MVSGVGSRVSESPEPVIVVPTRPGVVSLRSRISPDHRLLPFIDKDYSLYFDLG